MDQVQGGRGVPKGGVGAQTVSLKSCGWRRPEE